MLNLDNSTMLNGQTRSHHLTSLHDLLLLLLLLLHSHPLLQHMLGNLLLVWSNSHLLSTSYLDRLSRHPVNHLASRTSNHGWTSRCR